MEIMEMTILNKFYKSKKVFITGATGFKGSWLSIWLTQLGAEVYSLSLSPKTSNDNFVTCGLRDVINDTHIDIRDTSRVKELIDQIKPDILFHLAAQPLVLESYADPLETFNVNTIGTVNVLEAARKTKSIRTVIIVTSDKCYENREWIWGYRELDRLGGKDPYSASKACAELITTSYIHSFFSEEDTCAIASVRAGNVIGGGDWSEARIVPDFFRALNNNVSLELRNPLSTRPWQHVLEPLSGYIYLAMCLWEEKQKFQGAWNFGPKEMNNTSVQYLVNAMINCLDKGSYNIASITNKKHEANFLQLDISKAVNYLNWHPVLDFKETIELTCQGYEFEGKALDNRIAQINQYTTLAKARQVRWAQS